MKVDIIDINNSKTGSLEVKDSIFSIDPSQHTVYEAVKNVLANKRQGTSSTKTRGEIRGSTRKPFKQKGTGRARAGSKKSPLWKGGGAIFGPRPRDYSYKIPKKMKQKAYSSVLSQFIKDGKLRVIEDFPMEEVKTKRMIELFSLVTKSKKVIFILSKEKDTVSYERIKLSCRNIPWVKAVNVQSIEINDLFYSDEVFFQKSAIEEINNRYN